MSGQKPREIPAQVLSRLKWAPSGHLAGAFVEDLLEGAFAHSRLQPLDRHLCQELVYGLVRWQRTLDWLIAQKTDQRALKPKLRILLQLGLYQILWLDRIPDHAAVHETVELAKGIGFRAQAGFINAVLRGYLRELDSTKARLTDLRKTDPALGFSHPQWLFERWTKGWGAERATQLMQWNNTPPKTFARVNTLKADPGKLLQQWRDEGVDYDFVRRDWFEENLVFELKSHPPLGQLPSFNQGLFYVQDPSTLLAVNVCAPRPGETILDLCAAPGGKLSYAAQVMANEGRIVACDVTSERLKLISENCARLGITCIFPVLLSTLHPQPTTLFDRILIDAPCSNTGVMRRRVDLRWRIRPEEITRLAGEQVSLLRQALSRLKAGGRLVYSTCSLEPEENSGVVHEFLAEQSEFKLETERQLLPFADDVDGAYVALLIRR